MGHPISVANATTTPTTRACRTSLWWVCVLRHPACCVCLGWPPFRGRRRSTTACSPSSCLLPCVNTVQIYSQPSLDGEARVLLDPNTLSDDGTVALGGQSFSEDGSLYAYMLSSGGSDWRTIHVKRINQETGEAQGGLH